MRLCVVTRTCRRCCCPTWSSPEDAPASRDSPKDLKQKVNYNCFSCTLNFLLFVTLRRFLCNNSIHRHRGRLCTCSLLCCLPCTSHFLTLRVFVFSFFQWSVWCTWAVPPATRPEWSLSESASARCVPGSAAPSSVSWLERLCALLPIFLYAMFFFVLGLWLVILHDADRCNSCFVLNFSHLSVLIFSPLFFYQLRWVHFTNCGCPSRNTRNSVPPSLTESAHKFLVWDNSQ